MEKDKEKGYEHDLQVLYEWTLRLCDCTGESREAAEQFWKEINQVPEILREYAYYYENQEFLCDYRVDDYSVADILVWQMDHFRAHMDRGDGANRYDKDRLVLSTFCAMLELHKNPDKIKNQFSAETGTDLSGGWYLH